MELTEKEANELKKSYLRSYKPIERRIRKIEEDIKKLQLEADASKAIQYSSMPKGSVSLQSPQERYIIALEQAIERRAELKSAYIEKKREIEQAIHEVNDEDLETLLEYRYIDQMPWENIQKRMLYGRTQINRMHAKALRELKIQFNDVNTM